MKLTTFTHPNDPTRAKETRVGVVENDGVVDLSQAAPDLPREMLALLEVGPPALDAAQRAVEGAPRLSLAEVTLQAPLLRPPKFWRRAQLRRPRGGGGRPDADSSRYLQQAIDA